MMLMSMGWADIRDGKCLSDLGLPGVVIRVCLEQAAKSWQKCIGWFSRCGICDVYCSGFPMLGVRLVIIVR